MFSILLVVQAPDSASICVYCCTEVSVDNLTRDHVIAASWFPGTTPPNVEKWQVPACRQCNNHYSLLERELLVMLVHCADPKNPATAPIYKKVKRSLDPLKGKNDKDREKRRLAQTRFLRHVNEIVTLPDEGVLPSFRKNYDAGARLMIEIPVEMHNKVVRKWARGIHYWLLEELISQDSNIQVVHVEDWDAQTMFGSLRPLAKELHAGPDLRIFQISITADRLRQFIYGFSLWGEQFKVYALVDSIL